jgi:putative glutamine amidotransferase
MLKIGLSSCFFHPDPQRPIFKGKTLLYLEQSLAQWVLSEGVLAYMIPAPAEGSTVTLSDLAGAMDGLVLQGGSDVAPESYGEKPIKAEWSGDAIRDRYEIALLRAFRDQGKPVLGICRGAQLVNVAFGGTLYQDIEAQVPSAIKHRDWGIYDQNFHKLKLQGGLARLAGRSLAKVNSVHHQAVKELGQGLLAEALSETDSLVEAMRASAGPYLFAVQWHPEFQDPLAPDLLDGKVFLREFLQAVKTHA